MQKPFARHARGSGLEKLAIIARLEEYSVARSGEKYVISLETEAAEILMAMWHGAKQKAAQVKIKDERLQMLQIANHFRRAAANGVAMEYCLVNFEDGLEIYNVEIDFVPVIH